jgi:hypothetical protein
MGRMRAAGCRGRVFMFDHVELDALEAKGLDDGRCDAHSREISLLIMAFSISTGPRPALRVLRTATVLRRGG